VLDESLSLYPRSQWDKAYGSSGTIGAVADVLQAAGWPVSTITQEGLDWLQEKLLKAQRPEQLRLDGIRDDRRPVIGGGLAVLRAVFDLLQIHEMEAAQGALRHGALFDLIDRQSPGADVRTQMIAWLTQHFGVDALQAERVSRTAQALLAPMLGKTDAERHLRKLRWAAQLHEVGMRISHSDYHKHGAYILENTDLPGFTIDELHRLGLLVLGHRGKLKKLETSLEDPQFVVQLLALRLAVILCHARRDPDISDVQIELDSKRKTVRLQLSSEWASLWPQSAHLLKEEVIAWQKTEWKLMLT
jgi:exopolyphosphatase/guanosine-5'-triphosphate,3'-diphosphate pyrophosphatase